MCATEGATMADDKWFSRDLRVLDAVVTAFDEYGPEQIPDVGDLVTATGLEVVEVVKSLIALEGEFLEVGRAGDPDNWWVASITPSARRAVGSWPTPEHLAERVIEAISEAAETASEPETKSRLQRVGGALGGPAKDIFTKVLADVLVRQMGG